MSDNLIVCMEELFFRGEGDRKKIPIMKRVKQSLDARVICTIIRCAAPKLHALYSCAKMNGNNIIAKALLSFLI